MEIIINTHNCSREELQDLKDYLSNNSWDFKTNEEEEDDSIYSLRDNAIFSLLGKGETKIHELISNQELFEYTIIDREEFINTLIGWIGEATQDKELMKQDLFMLQEWDDEYIFSSISTNEYIRQGDSNFNELCENLLALNESTEKKIEKWKEDWGQTHEEICSNLGYDEQGSDDLLMGDYFWNQEDEKWYNKHSSTMTDEEEEITDFLRNNS